MNDAYNTTRVIDLLMERERAFVDVHHAEQQIQRLLGRPYPLPPPPDLPSLRKTKNTNKKNTTTNSSIRVRTLRADETAYRVHSLCHGERNVTLQTSQRLLRQVIENQSAAPDFCVLRIETVGMDTDGNEVVSDCLFDADA